MAGCLPLLVAAASFGGAPHPAAGHPLATLELLLAPVSVALTLLLDPGYQLDFPPSPPDALRDHFFLHFANLSTIAANSSL